MLSHALEAANLWEAFSRTVEAHSDRTALVLEEEEVTFSELKGAAETVAAWLASREIRCGDVVGIQLPKWRQTYFIWLACLRQGCAYVFIDPRNPLPRTEAILNRLEPRLVVTLGETQNRHGATLRLANPNEARHWVDLLPSGDPPPVPELHGMDPAYIMFTSGSTGEPKGAVIPHYGVLSLMRWVRNCIAAPEDARFSNINPLHFDNAVFDLFGGLLNGAALVPVETADLPNPAQWLRRLREGAASVIFAVPTLYQTLDRLKLLKPEKLPSARIFLFGGEGFPISPLSSFYARFRDQARLVNVYGPTETSCICSSIEIDEAELAAAGTGFPSLGRMHRDFDHAILDDDGLAAEVGTPGELWIGGPNVGLGYYANPEETALRFRQDPRQTRYRSIWYRTGDLVREDAGGRLWFVGRVDNQVKIRGHRIELEEIDLAIEGIASIKRAVTVAVPGPDGQELRAAFVAERALSIENVRAQLTKQLPHYMQPARILQVESLPLNANGKIDRKAVARVIRGDS